MVWNHFSKEKHTKKTINSPSFRREAFGTVRTRAGPCRANRIRSNPYNRAKKAIIFPFEPECVIRTNPYPFVPRSKPVQNPFASRSWTVREYVIFMLFVGKIESQNECFFWFFHQVLRALGSHWTSQSRVTTAFELTLLVQTGEIWGKSVRESQDFSVLHVSKEFLQDHVCFTVYTEVLQVCFWNLDGSRFCLKVSNIEVLLRFHHLGMADRGTSLRSQQWSCSELVQGAELCADMAGLSLAIEPEKLTREQLLQSIEDISNTLNGLVHACFCFEHEPLCDMITSPTCPNPGSQISTPNARDSFLDGTQKPFTGDFCAYQFHYM